MKITRMLCALVKNYDTSVTAWLRLKVIIRLAQHIFQYHHKQEILTRSCSSDWLRSAVPRSFSPVKSSLGLPTFSAISYEILDSSLSLSLSLSSSFFPLRLLFKKRKKERKEEKKISHHFLRLKVANIKSAFVVFFLHRC